MCYIVFIPRIQRPLRPASVFSMMMMMMMFVLTVFRLSLKTQCNWHHSVIDYALTCRIISLRRKWKGVAQSGGNLYPQNEILAMPLFISCGPGIDYE